MLLLCHILAVTILQMLIFSENWVFAKNINFYNVRPPLDPTPFPNSFKCFTCENAGDNYNCNRWAEDKWCPQGKYSQPFIHDQRAWSYCSLSSQISFISIKLHLWSVCGTEHDNMDTQYCLTVHHFTSRGRSTSITKKCASKNECHFVGCRHSWDSEHTECRSCCEGMICNVELPTNHTNAVFAVMHAQRTSGSSVPTPYLPVLAWLIMLPLL